MTMTRFVASTGFALAVLASSIGGAGLAHAESPPPFGFWVSPNGGSRLLIGRDAQCSLADRNGDITTSGPCSWNPTYGGGILTILSSQLYQPAPIYFSVVWVDDWTITVEGDPFYRQ